MQEKTPTSSIVLKVWRRNHFHPVGGVPIDVRYTTEIISNRGPNC